MINKVLGQSTPTATVNTTVYTVPTSCQTQCSVIVSNRTTSNDTFRLAIVPSGESIGDKHYIAYGVAISPGQFLQVSEIFLNTGDSFIAYTANGNISFTVTGIEANRQRMRMLT
jgi:hypothetical protein